MNNVSYALGQMAAAFVIALIIGVLSTIGRKKKLGVEAYRKRRGRVMMWTYYILLAICALMPRTVLTNRGYVHQIDFSILLIGVVLSLIIYGVYRFVIYQYRAIRNKESGDNDENNEEVTKKESMASSDEKQLTFAEEKTNEESIDE